MSKRPLTVLFDASPLINGHLSGVGYLTKGAIEALAANYPEEIKLIGHYFNFLGKKDTNNLPRANNIQYVESVILPGKVLSLFRRLGFQIPFELLIKRRGDIAFFPNFVSLPLLHRIPTVVTIADLGFLDFPQYVQVKNREFLRKFVPRSIKQAALIFAISKTTEQAIIKHYGIDENTIVVTPIPVAKMTHGNPRPDFIEGKYILFISTLEPRKNFLTLVKAYCALPKELKKQYSLVLAGGEGWDVEEDIIEVKRLQASGEKIIMTGYINEVTRAGLYEHASLFVMPSFYEGFGMPLLEAMSYDVPVLASDIPVFHEVVADAAEYASPYDPHDFTAKMTSLLSSEKLCEQLVKNGRKQVTKFSWNDVSRIMYESIIKLVKAK